jgi:hypothetical protein
MGAATAGPVPAGATHIKETNKRIIVTGRRLLFMEQTPEDQITQENG